VEVLKDNMLELFALIGISLISIGFFMLYIPLGFIMSGFMILVAVLGVSKGGD
jgi:hypothetical protein